MKDFAVEPALLTGRIDAPAGTRQASVGRRLPSVTVCVATHDRPHYMQACLGSLRTQTVGPQAFNIIVVDSCGSAETGQALRHMVAAMPNAELLRLDEPGSSAARNLGAAHSRADFIAFMDDDALAAPDWIEQIQTVIAEQDPWPGVVGGRVLPVWEAPLPGWWPPSLRGVLSIIEWEGRGEFRTPEVPSTVEPYGVNMIAQRRPLLEIGGFSGGLGRFGGILLSDEDIQVGWRLQDSGYSAWYDSRILVRHQIQGSRMNPGWLLNRIYWQGASTVVTRRTLGQPEEVWRELPRRLLVEALTSFAGLLPKDSSRLMPLRWRLAYAKGFTRMALAGERRKRSLPGHALRALLRRDGTPLVPQLDPTARSGFPPATRRPR